MTSGQSTRFHPLLFNAARALARSISLGTTVPGAIGRHRVFPFATTDDRAESGGPDRSDRRARTSLRRPSTALRVRSQPDRLGGPGGGSGASREAAPPAPAARRRWPGPRGRGRGPGGVVLARAVDRTAASNLRQKRAGETFCPSSQARTTRPSLVTSTWHWPPVVVVSSTAASRRCCSARLAGRSPPTTRARGPKARSSAASLAWKATALGGSDIRGDRALAVSQVKEVGDPRPVAPSG